MAPVDPSITPPPLPAGAPPALVAFVGCTTTDVELVDGPIRWLPAPPAVPRRLVRFLAPTLTIAPGTAGEGASLAVGWGPVRLRFTGTVIDGELVVAPQGRAAPGLGEVVAGFDRWVTQLNRWLQAGGWELASPTVTAGRLVLAKRRRDDPR